MTDIREHHAQLRAWAKGIHGLEAATELLIRGFRGRFADPGCPWVHPTASGYWIDFDAIPAQTGALSGGEQRFLQIAAALDDGKNTVNLGRCLAGLNRPSKPRMSNSVAASKPYIPLAQARSRA